MSEHFPKGFLRQHKTAEMTTAAGLTVAGLSVLAATKAIRANRRVASGVYVEPSKIPNSRVSSRRRTDNTFDPKQADDYREQLTLLRDGGMRRGSRRLLVDIAVHVYDATFNEADGSISFDQLQKQLAVKPRVLEKALGRLVSQEVILESNQSVTEGRIDGYRASPALAWLEASGKPDDAPDFHDSIMAIQEKRLVGLEGYYEE